ncbi:unnamed protein product [Plutella xylostella]|uniref:(diamondback moth) hypothetical protein n=1 Tax=Plutella xylostella TaxID=51655 RepID=A0A8S4FIA5_PLUXY|nr:unnamed protein product [Plutella xylostella]
MKIAIEGCAHGELEKIYRCIRLLQKRCNFELGLLICCGDFQAVRNTDDLSAMAVPDRYKHMRTFYKYYCGELLAPVLTLFIGGNHEASSHMQELPYGGWVAPRIYYMGRSGVVRFGNLRIGGLSGIYKGHDYHRGLHEYPPYNPSSIRSVFHVRSLDVFRLSQVKEKVHVMLSHDWPNGITDYGNKSALLRKKPFFRQDIESNRLGSNPAMVRCWALGVVK